MIESGSIAAAVELLRGTGYHEVLISALKRYNTEQSLFPLEVALDLHYWRRLWQETLNLQGLDQSQAMRIIGSLLDMTNLMWAIRYRVYQQLSEEELINYTLPFGYRLRDQDIRSRGRRRRYWRRRHKAVSGVSRCGRPAVGTQARVCRCLKPSSSAT